ncbi:E3 SUMO-protein ligase KIAA1586-like [Ruditapes philippinarum]|uniref:E3 SUMO-protein ligase KIAA1586-like n=1 Tax=Ruditapes philippinarum TaxID=129788 RepID=UPI00295B1F0C|nr:E3 SUMO-protein ligase KIAA1586-like [Ruditapes philippinarum]
MVKGKHKVGFDQKWTENRPWLFVEKSDNGQTNAMFCKLCQKHKSRGMNGSVTWTEKGCVTIRKDKVTDHENSEMHKFSLRLETEEQLGIHSAFSEKRLPMGEKEFEAVTCATKILHFLIKHNIPHTTVFKDFINFATTELKCPALQHLEKGKNAMYTSNTVVNELVNCMVDDIESTLKDRVERSPGYAVMTDETTDVTNDKHLAFCVKYVDVDSGDVCVDYIKDVKVDDGKAETIFCETKSVIEELNVDNFVAFGSDGCNTMIGKKTGVATRLKAMKPEIVTIHCHNHRLALAAKDSFESIKVMRDTDDLLSHTFKYYHAPANRTASLGKLQKLLDDSGNKKIKQAAHTRWLSHLDAVSSLRDSYSAVISDLENAVESGNDKVRLGSGPSANGLAKKLKTYESVHIVHFLCDALKPLTTLALTFERNDIDLSLVKPRMESTISSLKKLKQSEGLSTKRAAKIVSEHNINVTEQKIESVKKAEHLFIDNLVDHIERRLDSSDVVDCMSVFNMADQSTFYGNDEIMYLAEHFRMDVDETLQEWETVKSSLANIESKDIAGAMNMIKILNSVKHVTGNYCPHIEKLCATAAVSTY